jgi:hypothetical protein
LSYESPSNSSGVWLLDAARNLDGGLALRLWWRMTRTRSSRLKGTRNKEASYSLLDYN